MSRDNVVLMKTLILYLNNIVAQYYNYNIIFFMKYQLFNGLNLVNSYIYNEIRF